MRRTQPDMRHIFKLALLIGIPAEFAIYSFFNYPVGSAFDADDGPIHRMLAYLWLALHWAGVVSLPWLEQRGASALTEILVFVGTGYINTVLLTAACIVLWRWLRRRMLNPAPARAH